MASWFAVFCPVLLIWICIIFPDPYNFPWVFSDTDPYSTLMSRKKLTGKEILTTYACWLGPSGPVDKVNQVKMYKKYCLRDITSLKQKGSGSSSVSNSRIRICIKVKSRIRIHVKVKSRIQFRFKIVWIRNTFFVRGLLIPEANSFLPLERCYNTFEELSNLLYLLYKIINTSHSRKFRKNLQMSCS
jgi:hypothetical protein